MPPIEVNRRRFLGCSASTALAISQGSLAAAAASSLTGPVRVGVIGIGTRGTALLRSLLELDEAVVAAIADAETKHRQRGQGITEKAKGQRPDAFDDYRRLLDRRDIDAVVVAVPCHLHEPIYRDALQAGKHLYAEKPLGIDVESCDRLIAEAEKVPNLRVQVGFQRRHNPRFQEAIELIRSGELGRLIEIRASSWSSNGPILGHGGWLGRREESGDWMVEHAIHFWDAFHWLTGSLPVRASGWGRRDLFADKYPDRDVTDHYGVELEWVDGLRASFRQSWVAPPQEEFTGASFLVLGEQGGFDFNSGVLTYRDRDRKRRAIHPGPQPDTRLSLRDFLVSTRSTDAIRAATTLNSLRDARDANLAGLLVRKAVDERRSVSVSEIS